MSMNL